LFVLNPSNQVNDITEILLKVALKHQNTQSKKYFMQKLSFELI